MNILNHPWFKLKRENGVYGQCKGGHLADIIFLSVGLIYGFIVVTGVALRKILDGVANGFK